jgi:putative membrane protein
MNANAIEGAHNRSSLPARREATISDDKRATEYLANERTFLAWVRTSISIITLGFVMAKFSVWLRELAVRFDPQAQSVRTGASLPIGVTMMILGGVLTVLAARRYCVVNDGIAQGNVTADHGLIILVTLMVTLLALAMMTYMLLTSGKA